MAYDWILIKSEFVEGYLDDEGKTICPTLEELCERHGCSYSRITTKSSEGKWKQERQLFGNKRQENIREGKMDILVSESVNVDNKALNVANKGLKLVEVGLCDKDLSYHDMQKLSLTASTFHKMAKLALGEHTEYVKEDSKQTHDVNIHDQIKERAKYYDTLDTTTKGND
jgi:hypothetical protein